MISRGLPWPPAGWVIHRSNFVRGRSSPNWTCRPPTPSSHWQRNRNLKNVIQSLTDCLSGAACGQRCVFSFSSFPRFCSYQQFTKNSHSSNIWICVCYCFVFVPRLRAGGVARFVFLVPIVFSLLVCDVNGSLIVYCRFLIYLPTSEG